MQEKYKEVAKLKKLVKHIIATVLLVSLILFTFSCSSKNAEFTDNTSDVFSEHQTENTELDQNENSANPFSNITISCIGNSHTAATGVDRPYPVVVKNTLGLKEAFNYGVGWSTIASIPNCHCHADATYEYDHYPYVFRYSDIEESDIIIVQVSGGNDWGCLVPLGTIDDNVPTTYYGALNIVIEGLKTEFPDSYIMFINGFDAYGDTGSESDVKNRNGEYYRDFQEAVILACEKHNVDCLDIYHNLSFDKAVDTFDGTHPTQEYIDNVWAPMIADFIKENYN